MSYEYSPQRRKSSKTTLDQGKFRRHRNDLSNTIRKQKKAEIVTKRRELKTIGEATSDEVSGIIHSCVVTLKNENANEIETLQAVRSIRRLLSTGKDTPVAEVTESGILPLIICLLYKSQNEEIVFEATWVLTNVANTEHTSAVVDAVPFLVPLLLSKSEYLREQAVWCLSNIAGDSVQLRDIVLATDASTYIVQNINSPANESLLGNMVWALSNLSRGKPVPDLKLLQEVVPCLASVVRTIVNSPDAGDRTSILCDACWTFCHLSDGDDERIQKVVDAGIIETLVGFLSVPGLVVPALQTLSNIVTGNEEQTQAVLDCKVLDKMPALLESSKNIKRYACFMLSNIAGGNRVQVHAIYKKPAILALLVEATLSSEFDIRKEAIWTINNITAGGNDSHVVGLVYFGAIRGLCENLQLADTEMLMIVLNTLDSILVVGKRHEKAWDCLVDEAGGMDLIANLQQHRSDAIYQRAHSIIEAHFNGAEEVDVEDENIAPPSQGSSFAFGVPPKSLLEEIAAVGNLK